MTRVNSQTLATPASPSNSCTSKSRRRIRPGDDNNNKVAVVCTNIPSLSSKSKHQGNDHHFAAIAERGFRNAAATAVLELMEEHGYSRERAVCALLHEISSSGQTANSAIRPTDDKVRNTRWIGLLPMCVRGMQQNFLDRPLTNASFLLLPAVSRTIDIPYYAAVWYWYKSSRSGARGIVGAGKSQYRTGSLHC